MREIKISKAMNGFIVRVGCQLLVFETQAIMLVQLARYLEKPEQTEKEYVEKYGMNNQIGGPCSPDQQAIQSCEVTHERRY